MILLVYVFYEVDNDTETLHRVVQYWVLPIFFSSSSKAVQVKK